MKLSSNFILILAFIVGASLLSIEIASSRMIAVFFGSSLYVWLTVLCITLLGLAIGYFIGSKLSNHTKKEKFLSYILLLTSVAISLWYLSNPIALFLLQMFSLTGCVIFHTAFLLLFPMMGLGATSTLLANLLQRKTPHKEVYGKILMTSTLGSIVGAIICVLLLFPTLGILLSTMVYAIIIFLCAIIIFKNKSSLIVAGIIILSIVSLLTKNELKKYIYYNEGALSSISVIDKDSTRYLLVNNIIQSEMNLKTKKSNVKYIHFIDSLLPYSVNKKDALIIGLGGGLLANTLLLKNYNIIGVELDSRILLVAKQFFYLSPQIQNICADGQYFLDTAKTRKYNLIVLDIFKSEEQASYLLTRETLEKTKTLLADKNSMLIINWHGYYSGESARGTHILLNTLQSCKFYTQTVSTDKNQNYSNLILFSNLSGTELPNSVTKIYTDIKNIHTNTDFLMDLYNAKANFEWRKNYLGFIQLLNI